MADFLVGRTTNLTGKDRILLQAKDAWIKYQISETSTTDDSLKHKRAKATAKKLWARGGPHDKEFFRNFKTYLLEALKRFSA